MRVRVIKASRNSYWYSKHIGSIFYVKNGTSQDFVVLAPYDEKHGTRFIEKEDCTILPDLKLEDLKVDMRVMIRSDLVHAEEYGLCKFYADNGPSVEMKGEIESIKNTYFTIKCRHYHHSPEMILYTEDEMTPTKRVEKKKLTINDLKVGMRVKLRKDLVVGAMYGNLEYIRGMVNPVQTVTIDHIGRYNFKIKEGSYWYSTEMIDCIVEDSQKSNKIKVSKIKMPCIIDGLDDEKKNKIMHALGLKWAGGESIESVSIERCNCSLIIIKEDKRTLFASHKKDGKVCRDRDYPNYNYYHYDDIRFDGDDEEVIVKPYTRIKKYDKFVKNSKPQKFTQHRVEYIKFKKER